MDTLRANLDRLDRLYFENLRKNIADIESGIPRYLSVAGIDTPTELADYGATNEGNLLIAYDATYFTIYSWSSEVLVANSPYIVEGNGGYWVAIGGRYSSYSTRIGVLTALRLMASDANRGLSSTDLFNWIAGTIRRIEITDDLDGTVTIKTADALEIPDFTNAAHTHQNVAGGAQLDHGLAMSAASLLDDDHPQYLKITDFDSILCRNGEVLTYKGNVLTYG
jgi:hypothetical protein